MCKVPEGECFLGGGITDPENYEPSGEYRCDTCRVPVDEGGSDWCEQCLHLPMRRRVWRFFHDRPDPDYPWQLGCWGWDYTHKNWEWIPYGDGSGEGYIVKHKKGEQGWIKIRRLYDLPMICPVCGINP